MDYREIAARLRLVDNAKSLTQFAKNIDICTRATRALRMCVVAVNPPTQLEKLSCRMLVSRARCAEGEKAQVLKQIIKLLEFRVS